MIGAGPIQRMARQVAFARHIPLGKLVRRAGLMVRRGLADRRVLALAVTAGTAEVRRSGTPPQPIFAPRTHRAPKRVGADWRFTFQNRVVEMPGPTIDWSAPGPGNAAQLWRMNLHYMEYLEGVDDAMWAGPVDDWIAAHPGYAPGAWRDSWNSYALSIRVVVWLQELARRAGRLPPDVVARAERSALDQMRFLMRNLETDLGGNHLIKNIKAMIWASAYFSGDEPLDWRRKALHLLAAEIGRQILPDGVHYERSPSYHIQVLADLLECRHALGCDANGHDRLDAALDRMAQATADLAHPDGGPALFNDAGLAMTYAPAECLAVYERLRQRKPGQRAVFAFPDAGYFGMRSGASYFIADCGRIAPDELPAHGHGDVLSFEWSVESKRFIVDQGVYEYIGGRRRQEARSAAHHNTLCIDGADQADFFGAFRCGRRPNVEVRRWEPRNHGFLLEGGHDGFRYLRGQPIHVRRLEAAADAVRIDDIIEGRAQRAARIGFLLHPEVQVTGAAEQVKLVSGDTIVTVTASRPISVEPAVWWPDMGVEWQTQRLVVRIEPGQTATTTLSVGVRQVRSTVGQ
jgi:uncharacterized heparinase superfamily protein